LENLIERAFILCQVEEIGTECLPQHLLVGTTTPESGLDALEQVERETVRQALTRHDNNRTRAARELGIHRSTLIRKIKRYGL
jgi:transcriptional regulator of acetoin/glycerol metabolism